MNYENKENLDKNKIYSLYNLTFNCPSCHRELRLYEGLGLVNCDYCHTSYLLTGKENPESYYISNRTNRSQILETAKQIFKLDGVASDLSSNYEIEEVFLAYIPFWRYRGRALGLDIIGLAKDEKQTIDYMRNWVQDGEIITPASHIPDFGVDEIELSKEIIADGIRIQQPSKLLNKLKLADYKSIRSQGMVFEPIIRKDIAIENGREYLKQLAQIHNRNDKDKNTNVNIYFQKIAIIDEFIEQIYYPLWIIKYTYNDKLYTISIDGVKNKLLHTRVPGNIQGLLFFSLGTLGSVFAFIIYIINQDVETLREFISQPFNIIAGILIFAAFILWLQWGWNKFQYRGEVIYDARTETITLSDMSFTAKSNK